MGVFVYVIQSGGLDSPQSGDNINNPQLEFSFPPLILWQNVISPYTWLHYSAPTAQEQLLGNRHLAEFTTVHRAF